MRFDPSRISSNLAVWKNELINSRKIDFDEDYVPYWGLDDLYHKAGVKLGNCFYVLADVKAEGAETFYWYTDIMQLSGFSLEKFLNAIRAGNILIDFDVRTGHNHGTKFRIRQNAIPTLYENIKHI